MSNRILGEVVWSQTLECTDGASDKFYCVQITKLDDGCAVFIQFGPRRMMPHGGQVQKKHAALSARVALVRAKGLVAKKEGSGYCRTLNLDRIVPLILKEDEASRVAGASQRINSAEWVERPATPDWF